MPAWAIPMLIQAVEAIVFGVAGGVAAHAAGADIPTSIVAAVTTGLAKVFPSQMVAGGKAPS